MATVLPHQPRVPQQGKCSQCRAELMPEDCDACAGAGTVESDCGEDTCCCAGGHDDVTCGHCGGRGWFLVCGAGCNEPTEDDI